MNIAYTFDDAYTSITLVSLVSLLETNQEEDLNIYIVDCGIREENKELCRKTAGRYHRELTFVKAVDLAKRIPVVLDTLNWTPVCYVRLFFPELFPDLDRIVHIDGDTIVRRSLKSAYDIDFQDNLLASCYDCVPSTRASAGLASDTEYFNNGFMVFDLENMREEKTVDRFIDCIVASGGKLAHLDQDVVNRVLQGRICCLPAEFNVMTLPAVYREKCCSFFENGEIYYPKDQVAKAAANPAVVHFVGDKYISRPWEQPCYHPFAGEWIDWYRRAELADGEILLNRKRKKYGLLRDIFCRFWDLGNRVPCIQELEFLSRKKRIRAKCGR